MEYTVNREYLYRVQQPKLSRFPFGGNLLVQRQTFKQGHMDVLTANHTNGFLKGILSMTGL